MYNERYRSGRPIEERLWGAAVRDGECLIYRPESKNKRYASLLYQGVHWAAHRLAYTLAHGPLQPGEYVLHKCDRPRCIEPSHLSAGTAADNARDGHEKGRYPVGDQHPNHLHPETRPRGERHKNAKIGTADVLEIRRLSAAGVTGKALAIRFGIGTTQVSRILNRQTWEHV